MTTESDITMLDMNPIGCASAGTMLSDPGVRTCCMFSSIRGAQAPIRRRILRSAVAVAVAAFTVFLPPNVGISGAEESGGAGPANLVAGEYRLGTLDRVRLKVFEWRPARDEIFEWSALNAEYTIGASGKLAAPLVGEIPAVGRTTGELAAALAERLMERMGLASAPDVAVEVVQFRPFYVAGHVENPGEYPFRPGLTVLQALSISGGLMRKTDRGRMRLERDSMTGRGEIDILNAERDMLLARKARLDAEFNRADKITFPPELLTRSGARDLAIERLHKQETLVFEAHKGAYETQLRALKQLKDYLEKEVVSVTGQIAAHKRQLDTIKTELVGVSKLAAKGLITAPRRLTLERDLAGLEGDGLRLDGTRMKIHQEIARTEISMIELENKRSSDKTTELQATQIQLEVVAKKLDTARKLLYESEVIAPMLSGQYSRHPEAKPKFTILRGVRGGVSEVVVGEKTAMQPGDTLNVEIPSRFKDKVESERLGSGIGDLPSLDRLKRAAVKGSKKRFDD